MISFFAIQLFLSSFHFISLYLCLELQSFCYYVLAAYRKNSAYSAEAGLKFFILNSFASAFILFGLSICYLNFGTFEIRYISHFFFYLDFDQIPTILIMSVVMIICGFMFKLAVVPFHAWLPDIYDGSPFVSTSFFSLVSKLPSLIVFLNFIHVFFVPASFLFSNVLILFALLSIVIGSFGALFQIRLKRFMAYSSISQIGFIVLTISYDADMESLQAFLFYVIIYFTLNLTFFCCLLAYYNPVQDRKLSTIYDLSSIYNYNKFLAIILVFTLFSMAGIPPLAGFISKYYLIFKISEFDPNLVIPFLFLIVVTSSISVFYYVRIIALLFFEPDAIAEKEEDDYDEEEEAILFSKYEPGMVPLSKEPSMSYLLALFLVILFYFNICFIFFSNTFFYFISLLALHYFLIKNGNWIS
jgi:NADH-quinone oxidoreductase subunit N